jgi:hypothetical protein
MDKQTVEWTDTQIDKNRKISTHEQMKSTFRCCLLFVTFCIVNVDPTQEPEGHEGTVPTMFKQIAKEFKHSIPV